MCLVEGVSLAARDTSTARPATSVCWVAMDYLPFVPQQAPLAGAVELVFALRGYQPAHRLERLVPNGRMTLVIELDGRPRRIYDNESLEPVQTCRRTWLSGIHSRYLTIGDTDVESRLTAVQFAPDGSHPFTHCPAVDLCDRVVPADSVFGPSVFALREELIQLDQQSDVIDRLVDWLEHRYDPTRVPPRHLRRTVSRLVAAPSDVRIADLIDSETSISHKHFLSEFRRFVGPTPKSLQRILRFSQVFERIQAEERVDWAGLSHALGFADQGHFVREFKAFSGYRAGAVQGTTARSSELLSRGRKRNR